MREDNEAMGLASKQLKLLRQNCMIARRSVVGGGLKCLDVAADYLKDAESLYSSLKDSFELNARPLSSEDSFAYRIITARALEAYETAQEIVKEKIGETK